MRGIEPSNRRRIGSEACLSGSCRGGQPPRALPTKGTRPSWRFENKFAGGIYPAAQSRLSEKGVGG